MVMTFIPTHIWFITFPFSHEIKSIFISQRISYAAKHLYSLIIEHFIISNKIKMHCAKLDKPKLLANFLSNYILLISFNAFSLEILKFLFQKTKYRHLCSRESTRFCSGDGNWTLLFVWQKRKFIYSKLMWGLMLVHYILISIGYVLPMMAFV